MYSTKLAKGFFDVEVRPLLERAMPGTLSQISSGIFIPETEMTATINEMVSGESMPSFQILLFEQNDDLLKKINDTLSMGLPDFFENLRVSKIEGGGSQATVKAWHWQDFLDNFIGLRRRPTEPIGYAKVSEAQFYSLLAGLIFWDPDMDLARAQGQWDHMPQEVWYWRHHWAWKNIIQNPAIVSVQESDSSGMARLSAFKRVEWTTRLAFLTARKYAPPNRLLLRTLRNIADFGGIAERLSWCLNSSDIIETISLCDEVICELRAKLASKRIIPEDLGTTDNLKICDTQRISDHFMTLVPTNFRNQAGRICPIDLLGSLENSSRFAP